MTSQSLIAPKNQSVTFVELFFDLVFVFSITQITVTLNEHLDLTHVVQSILIYWLIWWSWQQFTWTLNSIDTNNQFVELATLLSTAIAFFMAISIPQAFGDRAILFAVTYVLTRIVGIYLQFKVSIELGRREIVKKWVSLSAGGLLLVLIGSVIGGDYQYVFWGVALILDLVAAISAGSEDWAIYPEHIAERHGLIVIVALGESMIVAAGGLIDPPLTMELFLIGSISVILTCGLWWSYFVKPKPMLEKAIKEASGVDKTLIARDVYSLSHFPMVAGIISLALVLEVAIAHPKESLSSEISIALAVGLLLFIGSTTFAVWRATGIILIVRIILILIASFFIISGLLPISKMLIALVFLIGILIIEHTLQFGSNSIEAKVL